MSTAAEGGRKKSLAQRARPEELRFRRQRFPVVLAAFGRLLAIMLRLLAVVRRLFAVMLRLFAVVRRLFTVVLTVLRRWLTLVMGALAVMLSPFFRRRRRVICRKSP